MVITFTHTQHLPCLSPMSPVVKTSTKHSEEVIRTDVMHIIKNIVGEQPVICKCSYVLVTTRPAMGLEEPWAAH